jgi:succinyl-CoA synthetase beta subunit
MIMARLYEYQGKAILKKHGIPIPSGAIVTSVEEAYTVATDIGKPVVVKAQVWVTKRADRNLIHFADTPEQARSHADNLLRQTLDGYAVDTVLIEEQVQIKHEMYVGIIIDDELRSPVLIFSGVGGTGIEDIARDHPDQVVRIPINIQTGLRDFEARDVVRQAGFIGKPLLKISNAIVRFCDAARSYDARSAEINPLVLTTSDDVVALDARFTVDDYAVFRHSDLNIEVAREFGHPPTPLEKIAWHVEKDDYRGTFYFIQMESGFDKGEGYIGFHGAGGGGSMMNMDALLAGGYKVANFVDTSGNPPASKVYRAARIILSQANIDGYYAGGSGVASQEQFHSARGLVKAFMDTPLSVPAVIRIGGNAEEQAIEILQRANKAVAAPIEAYGRDSSPEFCVDRLQDLIDTHNPKELPPTRNLEKSDKLYTFETVTGGTVTFDHQRCMACESKVCIETCVPQILSLEQDVPVLNIGTDEASRGGCTECLACEVECYFLGNQGGVVQLPIAGLGD